MATDFDHNILLLVERLRYFVDLGYYSMIEVRVVAEPNAAQPVLEIILLSKEFR